MVDRSQRPDDAVALWELLNCGVGFRGCSVSLLPAFTSFGGV